MPNVFDEIYAEDQVAEIKPPRPTEPTETNVFDEVYGAKTATEPQPTGPSTGPNVFDAIYDPFEGVGLDPTEARRRLKTHGQITASVDAGNDLSPTQQEAAVGLSDRMKADIAARLYEKERFSAGATIGDYTQNAQTYSLAAGDSEIGRELERHRISKGGSSVIGALTNKARKAAFGVMEKHTPQVMMKAIADIDERRQGPKVLTDEGYAMRFAMAHQHFLKQKPLWDMAAKIVKHPEGASKGLLEAEDAIWDMSEKDAAVLLSFVYEHSVENAEETTTLGGVATHIDRGSDQFWQFIVNMATLLGGDEHSNDIQLRLNRIKGAMLAGDPVAGRNILEEGLFGAAEMVVPLLATAAVGGVAGKIGGKVAGKIAGTAVWVPAGASTIYTGMRDAGIGHGESKVIALAGSVPYAMIEMLKARQLIPKKFLGKALRKGAKEVVKKTFRKAVTSRLLKAGAVYSAEWMEEVLQSGVTLSSIALGAYLDENAPGVDYKKQLKEIKKELIAAAKSLPWLMGGGQMAAGVSDVQATKTRKALNAKISRARAMGKYFRETAKSIREAAEERRTPTKTTEVAGETAVKPTEGTTPTEAAGEIEAAEDAESDGELPENVLHEDLLEDGWVQATTGTATEKTPTEVAETARSNGELVENVAGRSYYKVVSDDDTEVRAYENGDVLLMYPDGSKGFGRGGEGDWYRQEPADPAVKDAIGMAKAAVKRGDSTGKIKKLAETLRESDGDEAADAFLGEAGEHTGPDSPSAQRKLGAKKTKVQAKKTKVQEITAKSPVADMAIEDLFAEAESLKIDRGNLNHAELVDAVERARKGQAEDQAKTDELKEWTRTALQPKGGATAAEPESEPKPGKVSAKPPKVSAKPGKVSAKPPKATGDLAEMSYNELRTLARSLRVSAAGSKEAVADRIRQKQKDDAKKKPTAPAAKEPSKHPMRDKFEVIAQKQVGGSAAADVMRIWDSVAAEWARRTGGKAEDFWGQVLADVREGGDVTKPPGLDQSGLFDQGETDLFGRPIVRPMGGKQETLIGTGEMTERGVGEVEITDELEAEAVRIVTASGFKIKTAKELLGALRAKHKAATDAMFNKPTDPLPEAGEALIRAIKGGTLFQGERGGVQFIRDGKAILSLFENADVSTFLHELIHIVRRIPNFFSDAEIAILEKSAGVAGGKWNVPAEEKLAKAWEKFFMTGKAPTDMPGLKKVFKRLKALLRRLYQAIKHTGKVTPELRAVFDRILGSNVTLETAAEMKRRQVDDRAAARQVKMLEEAMRLQYNEYYGPIELEREAAEGEVDSGAEQYGQDALPTRFKDKLPTELKEAMSGQFNLMRLVSVSKPGDPDYGQSTGAADALGTLGAEEFVRRLALIGAGAKGEIERMAERLEAAGVSGEFNYGSPDVDVLNVVRKWRLLKDIKGEGLDEKPYLGDVEQRVREAYGLDAEAMLKQEAIDEAPSQLSQGPVEPWEMTGEEFENAEDTAFHGTNLDFDVFDLDKTKKWGKFGLWFAKGKGAKSFAELFGKNIKSAKVVLNSPKKISAEVWDGIRLEHAKDEAWFRNWRRKLIADGYDGLVIEGETEMFAGFEVHRPIDVAAFSNDQVMTHRQLVQRALYDGQPVPDRVLAEYPDLDRPEVLSQSMRRPVGRKKKEKVFSQPGKSQRAEAAKRNAAREEDLVSEKKGAIAGRVLRRIRKGFLNISEPMKRVDISLGKDVSARTISWAHEPDAGLIEWENTPLEDLGVAGPDANELAGMKYNEVIEMAKGMHLDTRGSKNIVAARIIADQNERGKARALAGGSTIAEYEKEIDELPEAWQTDINLIRGTPATPEGAALQNEALGEIPDYLRPTGETLKTISDEIWEVAHEITDGNIGYVEGYYYGAFEDSADGSRTVSSFMNYYQTTKRMTEKKVWPTYADALAFGLKLKDTNPVTNLRREMAQVLRLKAMIEFRQYLITTGEGKYILKLGDATPEEMAGKIGDFQEIHDPVFRAYTVHPDLAHVINNLIRVNQVTTNKYLRGLRHVANFGRAVKFAGSIFHMKTIAIQALIDSGGYGSFLNPKNIGDNLANIMTVGFRDNDVVFATPEYQKYVRLGGGHHGSAEYEAQAWIDRMLSGRDASTLWKVGRLAPKLVTQPFRAYTRWMFNKWIPWVKYVKYMEMVDRAEQKHGRELTDAEHVEIIKEGSNFYGEQNERMYGRSAGMTSALRLWFSAPGFGEGNYRTMYKALTQKGAGRSRANIPNSLGFTFMTASIATYLLTGQLPEPPEDWDDVRDLFKVKTGWPDAKGREIMIDLMSFDKDYFQQLVRPAGLALTGSPIKGLGEFLSTIPTRLGHMKASHLGPIADLYHLSSGDAIYDYFGNKVFYLTDPFTIKLQKLSVRWLREFQPISLSVAEKMIGQRVAPITALLTALLGIRMTLSEKERNVNEIARDVWDAQSRKEDMLWNIVKMNKPYEAIRDFNEMVERVKSHPDITDELVERLDKLTIDPVKLVANRIKRLTVRTIDEKDRERTINWLDKMGVSTDDAEDKLNAAMRESYKDSRLTPGEQRRRIAGKVERLQARLEGTETAELMRSTVAWLSERTLSDDKTEQLLKKLHDQGITTYGKARILLSRHHRKRNSQKKTARQAVRRLRARFKEPEAK